MNIGNRNLGQGEKRGRRARYDCRVQEFALRPGVRRRCEVQMVASHVGSAAQVIGRIEPGLELCGLTNGQFSMIDVLEHVLREIGPADIAVSTWTTGIYDERQAVGFYRNGLIRSARWLVDPLIFERRPQDVGPLIQAFGVEAFRAVNTHSKFAVLTNERFAVTVRSSMNLNRNTRLENFDLSEPREVAGFFLRLVDDVFSRNDRGVQRSRMFFEGLIAAGTAAGPAVEAEPEWSAALGSMADVGGLGDIGSLE